MYPSASNVGNVTGDTIWNSINTTIFGSDTFFDAFSNVYIIVQNQNGSTYTRYLYKVNIATLTATQVFQITGPVGNRNSSTNNSTTSDVGNIRGVAYLDGYVYAASGSGTNGNIRIYRININDGTSEHVRQYTFSGSASNIDLASNATFAAGCEAGEAAPTVNTTVSNTCPVATVNLNTAAHTGTVPTGAVLVWFTNNAHTGSAYATPTAAVAGTYYAFYHDETNDCYSPASTAVTVTINSCLVDLDTDNDGIPDSIEKTHCGVPLYSYQGQTTPGFIINELFFENFGTMNTTNGTTSTNLAGVGTGATTNYNYYNAIYGSVPTSYADGSGYPNSLQDGRYTVFNNIQYISSWANRIWQTRGDHTGGSATPGNGRMLIVNASYAPGEFYRKTLAGVIPYTPINASIWAMNLDTNVSGNNGRNLPNVTV